jgi:hypothetical protein
MACKRSAVRSRLAPPDHVLPIEYCKWPASPSSRGLGHIPFTDATGVRIPVGTPPLAGRGSLCQRRGGMRLFPKGSIARFLQHLSSIHSIITPKGRRGGTGASGGEIQQ